MTQIQVRNLENKEIRAMDLAESVFAYPAKPHLVHEAVVHFRAEGRAGTHATKNRRDVAGGGRKPWRQKKTGRARHGTIRSPLWRGGGVVHGPHPRDHGYAFPRRKRWSALRSVLSEKVREGKLIVVDGLSVGSHRTRELLGVMNKLGLAGSKTLFVDAEPNRDLDLAARNLQDVATARAMGLHAYHVLDHDMVVMSVPAVKQVQEWLGS